MMRPMPFWPSFDPWKNDTSVQVRTRRPRIQGGGGLRPSGALYSAGTRMIAFISRSSSAERTKPKIGENSSASPILVT